MNPLTPKSSSNFYTQTASTTKPTNKNRDFIHFTTKNLKNILGDSPCDQLLSILRKEQFIDSNNRVTDKFRNYPIQMLDQTALQPILTFLTTPIVHRAIVTPELRKKVLESIDLSPLHKQYNSKAIEDFKNSPIMTEENFELTLSFKLYDLLYFPYFDCFICEEFAHKILKDWFFNHLSELRKNDIDNLLTQLKENYDQRIKKFQGMQVVKFSCPKDKLDDLVEKNQFISKFLTSLICPEPFSNLENPNLICKDPNQFPFYHLLVSKGICRISEEFKSYENLVSTSIGNLEIRWVGEDTSDCIPLDSFEIPITNLNTQIRNIFWQVPNSQYFPIPPIIPTCKYPQLMWQAIIDRCTNIVHIENPFNKNANFHHVLPRILSLVTHSCRFDNDETIYLFLTSLLEESQNKEREIDSERLIQNITKYLNTILFEQPIATAAFFVLSHLYKKFQKDLNSKWVDDVILKTWEGLQIEGDSSLTHLIDHITDTLNQKLLPLEVLDSLIQWGGLLLTQSHSKEKSPVAYLTTGPCLEIHDDYPLLLSLQPLKAIDMLTTFFSRDDLAKEKRDCFESLFNFFLLNMNPEKPSWQLKRNWDLLNLPVAVLEDKILKILTADASAMKPLAFQLLLLCQNVEPKPDTFLSILEFLPLILISEKSVVLREKICLQVQHIIDESRSEFYQYYLMSIRTIVEKKDFDPATFAFSWANLAQNNFIVFSIVLDFWKKHLSMEKKKEFGQKLLKSFGTKEIKLALHLMQWLSKNQVFEKKEINVLILDLLKSFKRKKEVDFQEIHYFCKVVEKLFDTFDSSEIDFTSAIDSIDLLFLQREVSWLIQELVVKNSSAFALKLLDRALELKLLSTKYQDLPLLYAKICEGLIEEVPSNVDESLRLWSQAFDAGVWSTNVHIVESNLTHRTLGNSLLHDSEKMERFVANAVKCKLDRLSHEFFHAWALKQLDQCFEKKSFNTSSEMLVKYQSILTVDELEKFQKSLESQSLSVNLNVKKQEIEVLSIPEKKIEIEDFTSVQLSQNPIPVLPNFKKTLKEDKLEVKRELSFFDSLIEEINNSDETIIPSDLLEIWQKSTFQKLESADKTRTGKWLLEYFLAKSPRNAVLVFQELFALDLITQLEARNYFKTLIAEVKKTEQTTELTQLLPPLALCTKDLFKGLGEHAVKKIQKSKKNHSKDYEKIKIHVELSWLLESLYHQNLDDLANQLFSLLRLHGSHFGFQEVHYSSLGVLACRSLLKEKKINEFLTLWSDFNDKNFWKNSKDSESPLASLCQNLVETDVTSDKHEEVLVNPDLLEKFMRRAHQEKLDEEVKEGLYQMTYYQVNRHLEEKKAITDHQLASIERKQEVEDLSDVEKKERGESPSESKKKIEDSVSEERAFDKIDVLYKNFEVLLLPKHQLDIALKIFKKFLEKDKIQEACQVFKDLLNNSEANQDELYILAKQILEKIHEKKNIKKIFSELDELWKKNSFKTLFNREEKISLITEAVDLALLENVDLKRLFTFSEHLLDEMTKSPCHDCKKELVNKLLRVVTVLVKNYKIERKSFKDKMILSIDHINSTLKFHGLFEESCLFLIEIQFAQFSPKKSESFEQHVIWAFTEYLKKEKFEPQHVEHIAATLAFFKIEEFAPQSFSQLANICSGLIKHGEAKPIVSWIKFLWKNREKYVLDSSLLCNWIRFLLEKNEYGCAEEMLIFLRNKTQDMGQNQETLEVEIVLLWLQLAENCYSRYLKSFFSGTPDGSLLLEFDGFLLTMKDQFLKHFSKKTCILVNNSITSHLSRNEIKSAINLLLNYPLNIDNLLKIIFETASNTEEKEVVEKLAELFEKIKSKLLIQKKLYSFCWIKLVEALGNIQSKDLFKYLNGFYIIETIFSKKEDEDYLVKMMQVLCSQMVRLNDEDMYRKAVFIAQETKLSFISLHAIKFSFIHNFVQTKNLENFIKATTILKEMAKEVTDEHKPYHYCMAAMTLFEAFHYLEAEKIVEAIKSLEDQFSDIEKISLLLDEPREQIFQIQLKGWIKVCQLRLQLCQVEASKQFFWLNEELQKNKNNFQRDHLKFYFQTVLESLTPLLNSENTPYQFFENAFTTMHQLSVISSQDDQKGAMPDQDNQKDVIPAYLQLRLENVKKYYDCKDETLLKECSITNNFKLAKSFSNQDSYFYFLILLNKLLKTKSKSALANLSFLHMSFELAQILLLQFPSRYQELSELFLGFKTAPFLEAPSIGYQVYWHLGKRLFLEAQSKQVFDKENSEIIYARQLNSLCKPSLQIHLNKKNRLIINVVKDLIAEKRDSEGNLIGNEVFNIRHALSVVENAEITDEDTFLVIFNLLFEKVKLSKNRFVKVPVRLGTDGDNPLVLEFYPATHELICYFSHVMMGETCQVFPKAPLLIGQMIEHLMDLDNPPAHNLCRDIQYLLEVSRKVVLFKNHHLLFLNLIKKYMHRVIKEFQSKGVTAQKITECPHDILYVTGLELNEEEKKIHLSMLDEWFENLIQLDHPDMLKYVISQFANRYPSNSPKLVHLTNTLALAIKKHTDLKLELKKENKKVIAPIYSCFLQFMDKADGTEDVSKIFNCLTEHLLTILSKNKSYEDVDILITLVTKFIDDNTISLNPKVFSCLMQIIEVSLGMDKKEKEKCIEKVFAIICFIIKKHNYKNFGNELLNVCLQLALVPEFNFNFDMILDILKNTNVDSKALKRAYYAWKIK